MARYIIALGLVALGWIAGSLRVPYAEDLKLLLAGFVAAFLVLLSFIAIRRGLRKSGVVNQRTSVLPSIIILAAIAAFAFQVIKGRTTIKKQGEELASMRGELQQLKGADYRANATVEEGVIEDILEQVRQAEGAPLEEALIERIARTTKMLYPRPMLDRFGSSKQKYSVGRGMLLSQLYAIGVHETSLAQLKRRADFTQSYLSSAVLDGYDLSQLDLSNSYLNNAHINNANLSEASLKACEMRGVELLGVDARKADLRNAVLSWAKLNTSSFDSSNLNGVSLRSAQLNETDLTNTTIKYANLKYATLDKADLTGSNIVWSDLSNARLTHVRFDGALISKALFEESDLTGAHFDSTETHQQWFSELIERRNLGADPILQEYELTPDTLENGNVRFLIVEQ